MIIWSEKQYQSFLNKSGLKEPTSEKAETPITPVVQPVPAPQSRTIIQNVGKDWTKPVFMVCLTVIAVVGMVHEKPTNATPPTPVKVEQVIKHHRVKKKCYCSCKKHLTKPVHHSITNSRTKEGSKNNV